MSGSPEIIAGSATTGVGITVGFFATAIPILQFVSLAVGIIVGVLTAIYTWRRLRSGKRE